MTCWVGTTKHRSYRLLRSVLQPLGDWLLANEVADLAAQLPGLLRGVYDEHWRPATPVKHRSKADFLARIDHAFMNDPTIYTAEAVSIAPQVLSTKIGAGEVVDVRHALSGDVRALWVPSSRAA